MGQKSDCYTTLFRSSLCVLTSKAAQTNEREIHNARVLYNGLQTSLTGGIKTQFFSQIENAPSVNDGVSLYIHMTKLTMSSAKQISTIAFKNILNFNPKEYNYHIPNINTQSNHPFVLATTSTRIVSPEESLQKIITSYTCVLQPESWSQWVRNQIDDIEDGKISNPKDFMNQEYLKFYKICNTETGFKCSSQTITKDIVRGSSPRLRIIVSK